jgi:hypothetical protein
VFEIDLKDIPNATAAKRHLNYCILYTLLSSIVAIGTLKIFFTLLAAPMLCAAATFAVFCRLLLLQ